MSILNFDLKPTPKLLTITFELFSHHFNFMEFSGDFSSIKCVVMNVSPSINSRHKNQIYFTQIHVQTGGKIQALKILKLEAFLAVFGFRWLPLWVIGVWPAFCHLRMRWADAKKISVRANFQVL